MAKKTKVIVRRSTKNSAVESDHSESPALTEQEQTSEASADPQAEAQINETTAPEGISGELEAKPDSETAPQEALLNASWFNLESASPHKQNVMRTMLVLSDCCVQPCPEGIFDVLARNFDSPGFLSWWLTRIGKAHLIAFLSGKDIVDGIRKVSHELYRELKTEIGRPVARW
jgi:hypothetical protein